MNTTDNNKMIAEFMGFKPNKNTGFEVLYNEKTCEVLDKLKYHTDWNWLMQVVENIESLGIVVEIRENVCYIETSQGNYTSELEETKIQATYKAVVEFIKWYNDESKAS